jgi:hypothetical protein
MSTNQNVAQQRGEAERKVRQAATSHWMELLARLGYATRGVVYLLIGVLAVELAVGHGGKITDQRGALQTIAEQPFGKFLIVVVAIGLVGYGLWSLIEALFNPEGKGSNAQGIAARLGQAAVGIAYALLAIGAFQLAFGAPSAGKSSTASTQDWTAQLLSAPSGVALVVLVGLVVVAIALYLFYRAYAADFRKYLNLSCMSAQVSRWVLDLGRLGYAALGVVFSIIGIFLIVAAFQHNAAQAKGLDGALKEVAHQPFGQVLLALVALGLIAYGLFSFVEARYRRLT